MQSVTYESELCEQEVALVAQDVERVAAELHELLEWLSELLAAVDRVHHRRRQHEWHLVTASEFTRRILDWMNASIFLLLMRTSNRKSLD